MTDALQVMNELNLEEDFPADNITIFERHGENCVISRRVKTVNQCVC